MWSVWFSVRPTRKTYIAMKYMMENKAKISSEANITYDGFKLGVVGTSLRIEVAPDSLNLNTEPFFDLPFYLPFGITPERGQCATVTHSNANYRVLVVGWMGPVACRSSIN